MATRKQMAQLAAHKQATAALATREHEFTLRGKVIATWSPLTNEVNVANHGWLCDAATADEARAIVKRYMQTRLHSGVAY